MSAGPAYAADQLRLRAAHLAGRRRTLEFDVQEFHDYTARIGTGGLEAAGFDPGDAAEFLRLADIHGTLPGIYFGTATQASPYDFDDALTALRGPGIT